MRPRVRTWLRRALIVGGLILAGLAVPAVVDALGVANGMRQGRARFESVIRGGLSSRGDLSARAEAGAARFASARARANGSVWLGTWARVPLVGRPARWLREAASASATLAREAAGSIGRIEPVLDRAVREPGARVEFLASLERELARLRVVSDSIHLGSTGWFLPPVNAARREFDSQLRRVRTTLLNGEIAARGLRGFLGGPRTYVVLAANNAEMRSTGMALQAGLLYARDGRIAAGGFRPTASLILSESVPVPAEISGLYGWLDPGKDWRNTATSPNFPAVAPLYIAMAKQKGGGTADLDGVLEIDVVALRYLLDVIGPVEVEGQRYEASTVEQLVLHDLYGRFESEQEARRRDFSRLASATFEAVSQRRWDVAAMSRALQKAAAGRHLMLWSARADEQLAWGSLGIDGSLESDGLMVTVQNHTGNKLDWFLRPSVELSVRPGLAGRKRVRLRLRIDNPVPAGESPYVVGDGRFAPPGVYRAFVSVYLPGWASDVRLVDREYLVAGLDGPMRVVGARFDVAPGASEIITVEFEVPRGRERFVLLSSARALPIPFRIANLQLDDAVRRTVAL